MGTQAGQESRLSTFLFFLLLLLLPAGKTPAMAAG